MTAKRDLIEFCSWAADAFEAIQDSVDAIIPLVPDPFEAGRNAAVRLDKLSDQVKQLVAVLRDPTKDVCGEVHNR